MQKVKFTFVRQLSCLLSVVCLLLFVCFSIEIKAQRIRVETSNGPVLGATDTKVGYQYWKNIPFAAAPTGNYRWKSPVEPNSWTQDLDTAQFGPQCPQLCSLPAGLCATETSEDCLSLNVYRPISSSFTNSTNLPVMIFIPGGHFDMGTANCDLYEGGYFVNRGKVILVTINYRLGLLGFMVDKKRGIKGNLGIQDQRMALQWVQKNIGQFGGDANRVTLFGESAGAASVNTHLMSPLSKGLFHKVIIQSNPLSIPFLTPDVADKFSGYFAKEAGCQNDPSDQCYMSLKWQDIVVYQDAATSHLNIRHPFTLFMPYTPVIDGIELKTQLIESFLTGQFFKTDLMFGSCSEEARMFIYLAMSTPMNFVEYEAAIAALFFKHYWTVQKAYPALHSDKREDLSVLGTDYIFTAPTRYALAAAYNQTRSVNANMYLYVFDHALSFDGWGPKYPFCVNHTCHGADMPFTFHAFSKYSPTADEGRLSDTMIDYWTNFAYSGSPNKGPNSPPVQWEQFTPQNLNYMKLETPKVSLQVGYRRDKCDMWDKWGYRFYNS